MLQVDLTFRKIKIPFLLGTDLIPDLPLCGPKGSCTCEVETKWFMETASCVASGEILTAWTFSEGRNCVASWWWCSSWILCFTATMYRLFTFAGCFFNMNFWNLYIDTFHWFSVPFHYMHANCIYSVELLTHAVFSVSLPGPSFLQEKVVWARQNLLPSAEHLLSAQQDVQQHVYELMATVLLQLPHFGTRFDCLLVSIVKCVPLKYHPGDFLKGLWYLQRNEHVGTMTQF